MENFGKFSCLFSMYLAKALIVNDKKNDGFVKSPSAALRCDFVVTAPKGPHSLVFARLASGAFYETIVSVAFHEIIRIKRPDKNRLHFY
jgi:hypothetical protein